MTYRPELGISNMRYFDAFVSENALTRKHIYNDLSALSFSNSELNIQGGDTQTFTQNEDEIILSLVSDATAVTRQWAKSLPLPGAGSAQIVIVGAYMSSLNVASGWPAVTLWGGTPPAAFGTATDDRLSFKTTGIAKVIDGAADSSVNASIVIADDAYALVMADRTNSKLNVGVTSYGRKVYQTTEQTYPADTDLNGLDYFGFEIRQAQSVTSRTIISAPILVAVDA